MVLLNKPDFEKAIERIDAWFSHDIIDRPPVRFSAHNAEFSNPHILEDRTWTDLKSRWFDAEFQVEFFIESLKGHKFYGETFPVFWPNLGPGVYAAFHGADLTYGETTAWTNPVVNSWRDISKLKFDSQNKYFLKIKELTALALERCNDNYLVGYTDLHGSLDCVADWRGSEKLCYDMLVEPEMVHKLIEIANEHFLAVFDEFDSTLKEHGQPSVTWIGIPALGKNHIPSCDFSNMISGEMFDEFYLPSLQKEIKHMTHNIFHVDGRGVANHLDRILGQPEIQAIQWVQGMGHDKPILQWLPLIKRIQKTGKSVVIDLAVSELDDFIAGMDRKGLLLCIDAPEEIQPDILKRIEKW